jgi:hypothetical protein
VKPLEPSEFGDNKSELLFSEDVPAKVIPLVPEGIESVKEWRDRLRTAKIAVAPNTEVVRHSKEPWLS